MTLDFATLIVSLIVQISVDKSAAMLSLDVAGTSWRLPSGVRLGSDDRAAASPRPTLRPGEGTAPFHWVLDEVGARIVAAEQGISRDELPWRHTTALGLASSATLDHRMGVNEFFVRLAVEARAAGGALREWYGERATRRLLDGIAIPDGYGVITLPDRDPLHLLLELDHGTEPLRRIREKVNRYAKAIPRSELADADPLD